MVLGLGPLGPAGFRALGFRTLVLYDPCDSLDDLLPCSSRR